MKRIIIGISDTTGITYRIRILQIRKTLDHVVNHTVGRVLDLFDLNSSILKRPEGTHAPTGQEAHGRPQWN